MYRIVAYLILVGLLVTGVTGCTREQGTIAAALGVGLLLGVAASVPPPVATCHTHCHYEHCTSTCVAY